ncbi:MAG: PAS domain-containing protein [Bacteroidota bacterium]
MDTIAETLQAGGPVAIIAAIIGLTFVTFTLTIQLHRLAPVVAAWKGGKVPPANTFEIDDDTAIEFGTALTSACEVAAIAIDYQHRIRLYNDGAEVLTGWSAEHVLGQDLASLMLAEDARHHSGFVTAYLDRYKAGGPRLAGDVRPIRLRHRDGHVIHARARLIHINRGSKVIFAWLSLDRLEG